MSAPRRVLANAVALISRRCSERRYFLRPSELVNQILLYILAVAAKRHGILVHAFCVLSNHLHLVVSDPKAHLPRFEQYMNSLVARCINAHHRHWESFWAPGSFSGVVLITPQDMLDKIAYTLANPVAAGLVRRGREWPGLWSPPEAIGGAPLVVKRPERFFRKKGKMPEVAELQLVCPPGWDSVEDFRRQLEARLGQLEDEAAAKVEREGGSFIGVRKVLSQSPNGRPAAGEPRRQLNPRIACRDQAKRVEALSRLKSFLHEYREAWQKFAAGVRSAVFPHGTYWMRVTYGVQCAASG